MEFLKKIDWTILNDYISRGLIMINKHPEYDIWILNYTPETQYTRAWDLYTESCRGLVIDVDGNILARPFKKFFNYEELDPNIINLNQEYDVLEKMDGSLGILFYYHVKDEWIFASRGSFISEQATMGLKILKQKNIDFYIFDVTQTYLFEIIYPTNRIVVDYGEIWDVVLLGVINTFDGNEINYSSIFDKYSKHLTIVNKLTITNILTDLSKLKELEEDNKEGFVVKFNNGFRVKLKFDEYVRLHRIITNVSNLSVWKHLKDGGDFTTLLTNVPDEFYQWLTNTVESLKSQYLEIERRAIHTFVEIYYIGNKKERKEFAELATKSQYQSILFCLYTNKNYSEIIWKQIRPTYSKPFKDGYDVV